VTGLPTAPPARTRDALETLHEERDEAWRLHIRDIPDPHGEAIARAILDDPSRHLWRLVDAAMERLRCPDCGQEFGAGRRGCDACDRADGYRFAALEPDRPGVPPGNEHAIRVSSVVLRMPHRYPAEAVRGNELMLPLFMDGQMPRREQKPRLVLVLKALAAGPLLESARTFDEMLEIGADVSRRR
jgi:hypothetical protein